MRTHFILKVEIYSYLRLLVFLSHCRAAYPELTTSEARKRVAFSDEKILARGNTREVMPRKLSSPLTLSTDSLPINPTCDLPLEPTFPRDFATLTSTLLIDCQERRIVLGLFYLECSFARIPLIPTKEAVRMSRAKKKCDCYHLNIVHLTIRTRSSSDHCLRFVIHASP